MSTGGGNPGNVIGGHKANLKNPNTSEESKEHSREAIDDLQSGNTGHVSSGSKASGAGQQETIDGKNVRNVIGGYKAALKNPNVSEGAKERAEEALDDLGSK